MKNIYLLSNPAKTVVSPRTVGVSLPSRCRVLPIILLCLAFSTSVWGAEGDTHPIPVTNELASGLLLNGPATISNINFSDPGYSISSLAFNCKYNKTVGGVTFSVTIGGELFGSVTFNKNATETVYINGTEAASGDVVITCTNNCGSGTGKGTFYLYSITVTEGSSASCSNAVTISKGTPSNGTFNIDKTGEKKTCSGAVTVTVSDITPAAGYQFGEITQTGMATGVTIDNTAKTVTYDQDASGSSEINVTFTPLPTYAIRFFNNGSQVGATQNVYSGGTAILPANPDPCDEGYAFVGWWTAELDEDNTTSHTWITSNFTVSGAQDYYAVFSKAGDGGGTVTFKFDSIATAEGWTHDTKGHTPVNVGDVTLSVSGGSYNGRWYSGTYRVYSSETVTISSSAGAVTSVSSSPSKTFSIDEGVATLQSATNFTSIEVTYGETFYTTDCGSSCSTPTLTLSNGGATVNKFVGDPNFAVTASITPGSNPLGGTVTYSSSLPSKASVDPATGEVTIHDAMSTTPVVITATLGKVTSGTECQKQVKASYTLNIYNRVTWLVNGAPYTEGDPTQQAAEGGSITAYPTDPDGATACGGKTFVGWTDAPYPESDTKPSTLYTSLSSMSSVHITDNTTFYAVFAESGGGSDEIFKKGTSADLEDGQTVIIVNAASSKALSSTATASQTLTATLVSISSEQITNPTSDLKWTVTESGSYFQFSQGSNYLWAGYDESYILVASDEYQDQWSVTAASGSYYITDVDYSSRKLEYYPTNDEFTTFTTTGDNFKMDFYFPYASYSAYSTTCGPNIKADEVERLTSTQGQIVKSQAITIKGSSLTGGTLSVKSITGDASQFACVLASQTITAGAIETTYTISYTPTVSGTTHTAEIIFWDGTTESDPITLRGRSLPAQFAIVAYDGVNYYALDGSMSGTAKQATPLPVEVSANTVVSCPTRAIYSLTQRETPDANVYLVGPAGRLWGSSSSSDLNTKSLTSTSQTGWLLSTSDFDTYHITNADVTDRGLMLNTSSNYLGHYKTNQYGKTNYYGDLYILPFSSTCTSLNPPTSVSVIPKATTATITWAEVTDAISYDVTCSAGSVTVDVPNRKATITGLTNNSSYTFTVKAVATGTDCSVPYNGHFTTSNCDDVPYGVRVTPAATSATFKWSMESASATIRIYSDEECNTKVGEDHTGLTSPATITGLAENTQYYAKILAGGTCEGAVINFRTNSPSVEIAEWFPDSIRIIIDANADASVTIEDKHEHGSSTTNYADSLFFSKYFEADSENKLLALYNGTQDTIKLSNYCLKRSQRDASTYPTPNELTMELGSLGRVKPGYIVPNEELIIIRYANSESNSAEECASTQPGYENWYVYPSSSSEATFLNFSGPMSIGLYSKTAGKFIDVIGATTNSTGTGTLCQIDASNKKTCNEAQKSFNDMPGFYTLSGDNQQTPEVETNYGLSTNRCLIIRKNTVKSGVNAVTTNVYSTWQECSAEIAESFVTLSTEWAGLQVGPGTSSGETHSNTCIGMGYVGGFDYSGYYTTYDSIGGIKDLTGKQNDDGTYTIKIKDLDTLACTTMRIKVYEGGEEKVSREYQVPIMVDTDKEWLTTDTIFINDNPDQLRTYNTCKECDVVILKGATLTKAAHAGNDVDSIRNLTIYPGGTMKIPTGRSFNVGSVQFRVEGEDVPFIKLAGTLKSADEQVLVSRRIDNSDAYFFSLPYDCNISDIRWSNGEPAVLDDGFRIKEYDSRARADEGSTKGAPGHWKMVTGSVLEAGKGYQISVNSKHLKELIFPLEIHTTNVSDAENEKNSHGDNVVPIHQYTNGATTINNWNWNFIAQPYLCAMSPMAGDAITYGYLEYEIEEVAGEQQVVWYRRMEGNQYLTIYNPSTRTYDQTFWNSVPQLDPFLAFFVQGKTEGSFTFTEGNRKNSAPARHLASQAEVDDDPSIFVGVTLSGNGLTDQANLRVRQDFTEDEYKLGYDLLKFTTYYKDRPQVYMKTPSYQLAFQAVSDSVAKNTWLPMGVYCYKPGTYTFGLSNDYPIDEVEAVYLYDKVAGVTTNLLYDTYTITTSSQLYTNTRFTLNVIVNRREPQVTTDTGLPEAPDNMVRKILINGHVYIQRGAAIYDITGKQMLNF